MLWTSNYEPTWNKWKDKLSAKETRYKEKPNGNFRTEKQNNLLNKLNEMIYSCFFHLITNENLSLFIYTHITFLSSYSIPLYELTIF